MSLILPTPGAFVDPACPVAWEHPLNRGRMYWWSSLPNSGWFAGFPYRDLCLRRHGVLNSTTWGTGFNGFRIPVLSGGYMIATSCGLISTLTTKITLSVWLSGTAPNSYAGLLANWISPYPWMLDYFGGNVGIRINNSGGVAESSWAAYADNKLHHLCGTYDGVNLRTYIDGKQTVSTAYSTTLSAPGSTSVNIGINSEAPTYYWSGRIGDGSIWNRALSASEVHNLYSQGLRGNPETLRWVGSKVYSIPAITASSSIFRTATLSGLQSGGKFFVNPLV